jgi:hypothetical protein
VNARLQGVHRLHKVAMAKFIKRYFLVLPVDLFRMGELNRPNFTYLRTNPPRTDRFDVKLSQDGRILPRSGGLSFFDGPNYRVSPDWWVVEKGVPVPPSSTPTLAFWPF